MSAEAPTPATSPAPITKGAAVHHNPTGSFFGGAGLFAVGTTLAAHGVTPEAVCAFLGSAGLFLSGLASLVSRCTEFYRVHLQGRANAIPDPVREGVADDAGQVGGQGVRGDAKPEG